MEPEGSLIFSKQPAIYPRPQPYEASPCPTVLIFKGHFTWSSYPRLVLPSDLFYFWYLPKKLHGITSQKTMHLHEKRNFSVASLENNNPLEKFNMPNNSSQNIIKSAINLAELKVQKKRTKK
jgi:hypothetical protein